MKFAKSILATSIHARTSVHSSVLVFLADAVEKQPREEFHVRWGGAAPGRVGGDSAHAHMYLPRSRVAGPATLPVSSRRVGHLSAQQRVAWHRTT
ncbi:uncharacterized protein [Zea mays]|uniref:Uncharacterized protein n=1 Tax=Zea mays TaxID=4577 RepID=C0P6G2_MAIZE|nr:uncharacterized protein LOC100382316 [Zea mays]ACN28578.1 unknown [Zea mays]|eukprot:XP_020402502.1 uncharacterized protein LOC100382316 [Zea mays]